MHKQQDKSNANNLSTLTLICENIVSCIAQGSLLQRWPRHCLERVWRLPVVSQQRRCEDNAELWVTFSEGPGPALCLWSTRRTCEILLCVSVCSWGKERETPARMCRWNRQSCWHQKWIGSSHRFHELIYIINTNSSDFLRFLIPALIKSAFFASNSPFLQVQTPPWAAAAWVIALI